MRNSGGIIVEPGDRHTPTMPPPLYVFILRPIVYVIHFVIVSVVRANSINVDLTLMYNYRFATSVTNVTNVVVKRFLFSFSLHNIYYP